MKRSILFLFLFLLCCLAFCPLAGAETSTVSELGELFFCKSISSDNANLSVYGDGEVNISFSKTAPKLSVNVDLKMSPFPNNAVRLVLTNHSSCQSLTVNYRYVDEDHMAVTKRERFTLGARGVPTEYYIYTEMADRIVDLTLEFSGAATGSITLGALNSYSLCEDYEDACGNINSFGYDRKSGQLRIRGSVRYDIMTDNRTAKVSLYAVRIGQGSVPYGAEPIATVPMSSYFDFRVKMPNDSRFYAYIVTVENQNGEILHSFLPRVPCSELEAPEDGFFKGAVTDANILATRADVGMTVVDADISEMLSAAGNGYMYALDGLYYYFDRSFVNKLDAEIKNGYENGMEVYIRLLAPDNAETGLPGLIGFSDMYTLRLYAMVDFLCDRYSNYSRGIVSGVIFGRGISDELPETMSFARYTERYAESLYAVHEAMAEAGRPMRLVLPVADGVGQDGNSLSHPFLVSLADRIAGRFGGGLDLTVMLCESSIIRPDNADMEKLWGTAEFLRQLHTRAPMISEAHLCFFEPKTATDREVLSATLSLGYYTAVSRDKVNGFVFSTAYCPDIGLAESLFELYRYIDTQLAEDYVGRLLYGFGIMEWKKLIPDYNDKREVLTVYRKTTSPHAPPFRFLGEAYLWDFSGIANDYGWSAADGCASLMMKRDLETNRALVASMIPVVENDFLSEIVYRFDTPGAYAAVDALSFDVRVDAPGGKYHVTVQICTDGSIAESQATCEAGVLSRIYVNTAGLIGEEGIDCIRIFTAPATERTSEYSLAVGSISAHSTTMSRTNLEELISGSRLTESILPSEEDKVGVSVGWIYVLALASFVGVATVFILSLRGEEEKKDESV